MTDDQFKIFQLLQDLATHDIDDIEAALDVLSEDYPEDYDKLFDAVVDDYMCKGVDEVPGYFIN